MRDSLHSPIKLSDEAPLEGIPSPEETPRGWKEHLYRVVPALDSLRTYSAKTLTADTIAGLTVAAVAVPQAMAYALIAGIPPQYGLYTAIVMTAVGALLDSSRQLINGPTNAISIAVLSALAPITFANNDERIAAAVVLAMLVGVIQIIITLFRLGDLTRFISPAVIVGFTLGAGTLLVLDQFKNLLGLAPQPGEHFLIRFWRSIVLGTPDLWTTVLGLGTIAFVLGLRWTKSRVGAQMVPEFLIAMIMAAFAVWLFGLNQRGVEVIGEIPARLPSFKLPSAPWTQIPDLAKSALAIALLGLLEAIAMAKAIAAQTGQKLDINQQCLSEGVANLSGSFFQCIPGSGSLTRSAINQQAGAITQWSGVISAIAVALTVLLFAPFAYYVPRTALAAILMISAWRMVDRHLLLYHMRATRFDAGIVLATALAAVAISVEFCILIGVFLSFVLYVPRAAQVHMTELIVTPERVIREKLPTDPTCSRILIVNLEGELFFGSVPDFENHLATIEARCRNGMRVVVMRLKRVRNPDAACLGLLENFITTMLARNVTVLLCGIRPDMAKVLQSTGTGKLLGPRRIFLEEATVGSSTLDAIRNAYDLLQGDYCSICPKWAQMPAEGKEPWYYVI